MNIVLRPATPEDDQWLLALRNSPDVIAGSFSERMADSSYLLGTLLLVCMPVGYIRLDARPSGEQEVSIVLVPNVRGHGVGTAALRELRRQSVGPLIAQIKPENEPSLRAFAKAGFHEIDRRADRVLLATP